MVAGPGAGEAALPEPVRAFGQSALVVPVDGHRRAAALADRVREARWPAVVDVVGGLDTVTVVLEPGRRLEELRAAAGAVVQWMADRDRARARAGAAEAVGVEDAEAAGNAEAGGGGTDVGGTIGGPLRRDPDRAVHPGRRIEVPTVFGGADLAEVGRTTGLGPDAVVDALAGSDLEVAFLGFSPGFAYLTGLPPALAEVPRRPSPRPSVPAGSVALAGGFAAVYPSVTPGGWQLLGRTAMALFDPASPPFAVLAPGDRVRFVPVGDRATGRAVTRGDADGAGHASNAREASRPGGGAGAVATEDAVIAGAVGPAGAREDGDVAAGDAGDHGGPTGAAGTSSGGVPGAGPTPVFRVESPGSLTTVQDGGRLGFAHLGVPRSGPADPIAHALANRLVGNAASDPALETTGQGPALRCLADTHVAVVGGGAPVRLDGLDVPAETVVPVARGQLLEIGVPTDGLRATVAVAGGAGRAAADRAVGSLAADTLSGLGTPPLRPGDVLCRTDRPGPLGGRVAPGWDDPIRPATGREAGRRLRVLPGPHPELFDDDVMTRLAAMTFVVDPASNRVGMRLRPAGTECAGAAGEADAGGGPAAAGSTAAARRATAAGITRRPGELASQGMVTGAVQVPPDGTPVVLLPDHATHGGYPVVAVVIDADLAVLGRCRPGDAVRLEPVSRVAADEAWRALCRAVDAAVAGRYPIEAG